MDASSPASPETHLLLIRFSALGDILMTVPVIDALARQYPHVHITVVSRPFVGSIIRLLPENVSFFGINPHGLSVSHLYRELRVLSPTHVCDLHDVLRTKLLRWRFRLAGLPVDHIHKERRARRAFVAAGEKHPQKTAFRKYAEALGRMGFPVVIDETQPFRLIAPIPHGKSDVPRIGIAPFAAHQGKIYPLDRMEQVVAMLSEREVQVYLFGAGATEKQQMEEWAARYQGVESVVGRLEDMAAELHLMASLDAMLTMDSGNMHLASLAGVRVVSIWGATHPLGGFLGWGQRMEDVVELDLPCRPCSIYGSRPCRFGDWHCLTGIKKEAIVERLLSR